MGKDGRGVMPTLLNEWCSMKDSSARLSCDFNDGKSAAWVVYCDDRPKMMLCVEHHNEYHLNRVVSL